MSATLDSKFIFEDDRLSIRAGSWKRGSIERAIAGLDGTLSIDLGLRSRRIKQLGVLRGVSEAGLQEMISSIGGYMDGATHTLQVSGGELYDNLRMDSFEVGQKQFGGGGVCCGYEISYTQLRD